MSGRGELLRSYFVPNGSYLMELAEDGSPAAQVQALQAIGRAVEQDLEADAVIVASPHWLPKSGFFVDPGEIHESFTITCCDRRPLRDTSIRMSWVANQHSRRRS